MSTLINGKENHLDAKEPKWFAVYTKYKREKLVAKELDRKGIEHYLPIQELTRQWGRKKKTVSLPLFSCYIFVKITKAEYIQVLQTEYVVNFIQFARNLIAIPHEEIEVIRRIIGEGITVQTEAISFNEGDEVEIVRGNLTGLRGRLVKKQSGHNFLVELQQIGHQLMIQLDPHLLSKVKNASLTY